MHAKVDDAVRQDIARLKAEGHSGNAIAQALGLGRATVQKELAVLGAAQDLSPTPLAEPVPLDKIYLYPALHARVTINDEAVEDYAEAMQEGATFPPVVLFFDGDGYWVGDGHHRCRAAVKAGTETIMAEVREGDERAALLHGFTANRAQGLRLTRADKHWAVSCMLQDEEWRQWSDREIARQCGVSHPVVGKRRAEIEAYRAEREAQNGQLTGNITSERTYVTRHGTVATMDTSRIGVRDEEAAADEDFWRGLPENAWHRRSRRLPIRIPPRRSSVEAEQQLWDDFMSMLEMVISDFALGGNLESLLGVWSPAQRQQARDTLSCHREQLAQLDAQFPVEDA